MFMMMWVVLIFLFVDSSVSQSLDAGAPNYTCGPGLMMPSKIRPTNVNALRPADINIIMALGDSLTAGNGARAIHISEVLNQYRGLSFTMGGEKTLEEHITIPNILKKYNPNLFGYSRGMGVWHAPNISNFNMAFPGAKAKDLPKQAKNLIRVLKKHEEKIDIKNDWKLLNIHIGGNDLCSYCHNETVYSAENFIKNIKMAVSIIKSAVPRVLVNLITIFNIDLVRQLDENNGACKGLHIFECKCEANVEFTNERMRSVSSSYRRMQKQLEESGIFDSDDFTLVRQPFFENLVEAPKLSNGFVNLRFFAPDCFHFSQLGHSVVASWVWKNMLEPVGRKSSNPGLSDAAIPLACPDPDEIDFCNSRKTLLYDEIDRCSHELVREKRDDNEKTLKEDAKRWIFHFNFPGHYKDGIFATKKVGRACCSCAYGPAGEPGLQGETGKPGVDGRPGHNGLHGQPARQPPKPKIDWCFDCSAAPAGKPGKPGLQGRSGKNGKPGKDGLNGMPGLPGECGKPGLPGSTGHRGEKGRPGKPGLLILVEGPIASPGRAGTDGLPGALGQAGRAGANGRDGIKGLPGDRGMPGRPGMPGLAGIPGIPGLNGIPGGCEHCPVPNTPPGY